MHAFKRLAVYLGLCQGYARKDTQAGLLDRLRQPALHDNGLDIGQISVRQMHTTMLMMVSVPVLITALMTVIRPVTMPVLMRVIRRVIRPVRRLRIMASFTLLCSPRSAKPHMYLHALYAAALLGLALKAKLVLKAQLGKLGFEVIGADPKINHGGKIHVAADSRKAVVVKNLHKTPVK